MVNFHVIDVGINALHVRRQLYLPVYIKRITGVLFFPVIPIPRGVPDGNPLGVAALSLENEKVNVVTNMPVFKKAPCYYQGKDISDAGGEIFLDSGYNGHKDFFACNDEVSPNSYLMFKYVNRLKVKSFTEFEQYQINLTRLKSLKERLILYGKRQGNGITYFRGTFDTYIESGNNILIRLIITIIEENVITSSFTIAKSDLNTEIYGFMKPLEGGKSEPYFHISEDDENYDEPYNLKIVLRHEIE